MRKTGNNQLMRHGAEYLLASAVIKTLGALPRPAGDVLARLIANLLRLLTPRLCAVADTNLRLASPTMSPRERERITRGVYYNLARVLNESAHFPRLTPANINQLVSFEGFENYESALERGKGVIFLTAHLGVWELGAFAHALHGHQLNVVYRALDNPLLDQLARRYRELSGNKMVEKNESARHILAALARNETVGILADQNTLPEEGVFVDFFGVQACMTAGVARLALHTGAAVVPAFCVWEAGRNCYSIYYDRAMTFQPTGNSATDVQVATQRMAAVIETYVRRDPDQWLWIHRRWKTRPASEPPIYK
jgi:KDO2-lipid IV(A) lauroyltransferase